MARATKLASKGGRLSSSKSKTNDPRCSQAMSDWVRGRKTGSVAPEVFSILAKCRQKASQNRKAELQQQSGKLAGAGGKTSVDTGRGTWQRSEQAAKLVAERRAKLASRGQSELQAKAAAMRTDGPSLREQAAAFRAAKGTRGERAAGLAKSAQAREDKLARRPRELQDQLNSINDKAKRARKPEVKAAYKAESEAFYQKNLPVVQDTYRRIGILGNRQKALSAIPGQERLKQVSQRKGITIEQASQRAKDAAALRTLRNAPGTADYSHIAHTRPDLKSKVDTSIKRKHKLAADRAMMASDSARLSERRIQRDLLRSDPKRYADRLEAVRGTIARGRSYRGKAQGEEIKKEYQQLREDLPNRAGMFHVSDRETKITGLYGRKMPSITKEVRRRIAAEDIREIRAKYQKLPETQAKLAAQRERAAQREASKFSLFGGQTPSQRPYTKTATVPAAAPKPQGMTLRQQVNAHRAEKGSRSDRIRKVMNKLYRKNYAVRMQREKKYGGMLEDAMKRESLASAIRDTRKGGQFFPSDGSYSKEARIYNEARVQATGMVRESRERRAAKAAARSAAAAPAAAPKPAAVASTKPAKGTREERLARITQRREARFEKTFQDTFNRLDRKGDNQVGLPELRDSLAKRFSREQFDKGVNQLRRERKFSLDTHEGMTGRLSQRQLDASIRENGAVLYWASRNTASAERVRTPRFKNKKTPSVRLSI